MQSALVTVRKQLSAKKQELCRLCREEEDLSDAMKTAQEEFDEIMLKLQGRRETLALLSIEQECAW